MDEVRFIWFQEARSLKQIFSFCIIYISCFDHFHFIKKKTSVKIHLVCYHLENKYVVQFV